MRWLTLSCLLAFLCNSLFGQNSSSLADAGGPRSFLAIDGIFLSHEIILSPDEWTDYVKERLSHLIQSKTSK